MLNLDPYLDDCAVIDWKHPAITAQALLLAADEPEQTVLHCFNFVRDHIEHSVDFHREIITIKASDVLTAGTGLCFAKSHLLVALLRAGINAHWEAGCDHLAYALTYPGEQLYRGIWAQPWPQLIAQLQACPSVAAYCSAPLDLTPPMLTLVA